MSAAKTPAVSNEEKFYFSDNDYSDSSNIGKPLVPRTFSNVETALKQFDMVFNFRYGKKHVNFSQVPLRATFMKAFYASGISERKPLVLYLHNEESVVANMFASSIFGDDKIASLLNEKFILFGWDCTRDENIEFIINWLHDVHADGIKAIVEGAWSDNYPLMVVIQKDHGVITTTTNICNHDGVDVVYQKLVQAVNAFESAKTRQAVEARSQAERKQLKAEQEELSKEQNRLKMEARAQLAREEREALEASLKSQKDATDKALKELLATLPKESAATDAGIITIRFRFPDNHQEMRCFLRSDPLKLLVHFAESRGYQSDNYRIFTSDFPRKDVATLDMESTFDDLKWSPREQVIVKAI